jgi:hypothetical protein
MVQGIFDAKGKAITPSLQLPDVSHYDKIVGTLESSARAGSPATGGKGVIKDRVGISTFVGNVVVRDQGGTKKVEMGQLGLGNWGLSVFDGNFFGGQIEIGSGNNIFKANKDGAWLGHVDKESAPLVLNMDGSLLAEKGVIGGFTITSDSLYGGKIATAAMVGAGSAGVIMDTAGLRGYDPVLGKVFDLPTDGTPPEFSSGVIRNTEYVLQTSSVIRTSDTVGDGTSASAGVLMNNTGIYAAAPNQTLANANVKILANGEATFSGSVKGGQTDFMTGEGYFIGLSSGLYKMSIGNPDGNFISWDGDFLRIRGNLELTSPLTNVSYTTVNLPVPPTDTGLNSPSDFE